MWEASTFVWVCISPETHYLTWIPLTVTVVEDMQGKPQRKNSGKYVWPRQSPWTFRLNTHRVLFLPGKKRVGVSAHWLISWGLFTTRIHSWAFCLVSTQGAQRKPLEEGPQRCEPTLLLYLRWGLGQHFL